MTDGENWHRMSNSRLLARHLAREVRENSDDDDHDRLRTLAASALLLSPP
jgi:hypothetical protein